MLQRERQSTEVGAKPKPHSWCKKLLIGTIITSLTITTILPSLAFAKSKKKVKENTTLAQLANDGGKDNIKDTNNGVVKSTFSIEGYVEYKGRLYHNKVETNDDWDYLNLYTDGVWDGKEDISEFIKNNFSGKFTNREMTMGNPSFIIKGVDGKGNYCYLLFSDVYGKYNVTPILSGFRKDILDKLGVEDKCIFDEEKKEWRISYQKDGITAYFVYNENGKELNCDYEEFMQKIYLPATK